jgi:hypothetical protein
VARRLRSLRRNLDRDGLKVRALAVFGTYDPRAAAGFLTIGLGVAGGLGGGGRTAGKAVSDVADWGERERKSVVPLPQRVVAVVTDGTVVLYGRQRFGGAGERLIVWRQGEFTATVRRRRYAGLVEVHVQQPDTRTAWLIGKAGLINRAAAECARLIVELSATSA